MSNLSLEIALNTSRFLTNAIVILVGLGCTNSTPYQANYRTAGISGRVLCKLEKRSGRIDVAGDEYLKQVFPSGKPNDTILVNPDSTLRNAFVQVRARSKARTQVLPGQRRIMYMKWGEFLPRVIGAQEGDTLTIESLDPIEYRPVLIADSGRAVPFSGSLVLKGHLNEVRKFTCDVHAGTVGYLWVVDHPFHSVTGDGGKFRFENIPVGEVDLEVWHESLGLRRVTLNLSEGQGATIDVSF